MAWSYSLEKEGDGPGMASFRFGAMTLLMPHFPGSIYIQYVQVMSRCGSTETVNSHQVQRLLPPNRLGFSLASPKGTLSTLSVRVRGGQPSLEVQGGCTVHERRSERTRGKRMTMTRMSEG